MFKLESYVTPLLLSYVNKYIKNLKPEDSQLSLWDGDASFCNLDLRLDVLEQELDLPFTFVNGHIHELRIHVPWTKLGSEPVIITINTIECVLKLYGDNSLSPDVAGHVIQNIGSPVRKFHKRDETPEAPPGYVQSLINRVIGNICIVCNNLILKYVEDDIVLSLNIKSAELFNVDEKWERAFVDINTAEAVVRKVVSMQDLTVCLDKRDASGKIEAYQDPLLYRCSTMWRIHTVYNSSNAKYPSITRINMFCDKLDFSLTDQQLPMFLRLAKLCYALQYKDAHVKKEVRDNDGNYLEGNDFLENEMNEGQKTSLNDSWGSWMWSLVPFTWEGIDDANVETERAKQQKILQFGIFIERASCAFKVTEAFNDACFGSAKYIFSPFSLLHFRGCFMEITVRGKDFLNMQLGITGATVSAQNSCVCGFPGKYSEEIPFIISGVFPDNENEFNYLSSTLFDPLAPENCGKSRKYCLDVEQHLSLLTEEVMAKKFPSFFLDYIYALDIPDEWLDKVSQVTSTFLEESNWQERSVCRFVLGPFNADLTSHLVHIVEKIIHCCVDYEYPSYLFPQSGKSVGKSSDVKEEDIEGLETFTPFRLYQLTLFKPVLHLCVADHKHFDSATRLQKKKARKKKRNAESSVDSRKPVLPCLVLEINADCLKVSLQCTMYPDRYARIASTMSVLPEKLLHNCFSQYSANVLRGKALLLKQDASCGHEKFIVSPLTFSVKMNALNHPEYWVQHNKLPLKKIELKCNIIEFCLTEKHLLALMCIYMSWTAKDFGFDRLANCTVFRNDLERSSEIQFEVCGVDYLFLRTKCASIHKGCISSILVKLQDFEHSSVLLQGPELTENVYEGQKFCMNSYDDLEFNNRKPDYWFKFMAHIPDRVLEDPSLLTVSVEGTAIVLEPALSTWLGSKLPEYLEDSVFDSLTLKTPTDIDEDSMDSSHTTPALSGSRSLSREQSAVTNMNNDVHIFNTLEKFLIENYCTLKHLAVQVEFAGFVILSTKAPWSIKYNAKSCLESLKYGITENQLTDAVFLCLPKIHMKNNGTSSFNNQLTIFDERDHLVHLKKEESKCDGFPWTLKIAGFSAYTVKASGGKKVLFLVNPCGASVTIALTSKTSQNQLALCVHIDTTALNMNFSHAQVVLISECVDAVSSYMRIPNSVKEWIHYFQTKPTTETTALSVDKIFTVVKCDAFSSPQKLISVKGSLKDGNSATEKSDDKIAIESKQKVTLWVQLTVSKFSFSLFNKLSGSMHTFQCKLVSEEVITSLDIQEVYSKAKMKISSLNINCFMRKENEWHLGPYEGVVLCSGNKIRSTKSWSNSAVLSHRMNTKLENQPFLLFTYTRASCLNANQKWTANFDESFHSILDTTKYISELDICLRPFDVILWPTLLVSISEIFLPLENSFIHGSPKSVDKNSPVGIEFSNQNLPLMYIRSSAVRVFLPKELQWDDDNLKQKPYIYGGKNSSQPDIICLCLDYINLTSQVENPLSRIVLNAELYAAALRSRTLNLPGSNIEDRQYQLDICGLSLGSVSSSEITKSRYERKEASDGYTAIMGENPALEWNIGVINEGRKQSDEEPIAIVPFLSPFDLRVAVAPAIVSNNHPVKYKGEEIISGITVEVSIISDIFVYISATQLQLLSSVVQNNLEFILTLATSAELEKKCGKYEATELRDSGLESETSSTFHHYTASPRDTKRANVFDFVPFEILLTAGSISLVLFIVENEKLADMKGLCKNLRNYHGREDSNVSLTDADTFFSARPRRKSSVFLSTRNLEENFSKDEDGYDGSSDSSGNDNYFKSCIGQTKPEVSSSILISITQPHAFLKCHPLSQRFEASCFDFQVKGSVIDRPAKKNKATPVPLLTDFNITYLDTRPGEPDEKTGIPPAFCTFTCCEFFNEPPAVVFRIERPFKCSINSQLLDQCESLLESFCGRMLLENENRSNFPLKNSKSNPQNDFKLSVLSHISLMKISATQMLFEIAIDCSPEPVVFMASCDDFRTEVEVSVDSTVIKNVTSRMNIKNISAKISTCNENWPFLLPVCASATFRCHFDPYFQIISFFDSEAVIFNVSLKHLLIINDAIKIMSTFWTSRFSRMILILNSESSGINAINATCATVKPKQQFWSDDLRKGSFSFIQASDMQNSTPNAYEVAFTNAENGHPAAMIWRYPEPRCLTKIEVCPVPLHNTGNKHGKVPFEMVTCFVQYWDSLHHNFQTLCEFELSETSHCLLSFPLSDVTSLAFSDLWQVILCHGIDLNRSAAKQDFVLSPLVLAACMNIDSCYDENLVPTMQLMASSSLLKLNLHSVLNENGCMNRFFPFTFDGTAPVYQEFMTMSFEKISGHSLKWCNGCKLEISSHLLCNVIEYRNLTFLPLFDPVKFSFHIFSSYECDRFPIVEVEMKIQSCIVKISQSIIHTLSYALYSCSKVWNEWSGSYSAECMLPNYYMICNNAHELIRFGQVDTDESIILPSHKMHAYSWRSQKSKQQLRICLECMKWNWSEAFDIDECGFTEITLINDIVVRIIVKPLSNLQKQVIVEGCLKVFNYLSWDVSLKLGIMKQNQDSENLQKRKEITSELKCHTCVSLLVPTNLNIGLAVRDSSDHELSWSRFIKIHRGDENIVVSLHGRIEKQILLQIRMNKNKGNDKMHIFLAPQLVIRNRLPFPLVYSCENLNLADSVHRTVLGEGKEFNFFEVLDFEKPFQLAFDEKCTDQSYTIEIPTAEAKKLFFNPVDLPVEYDIDVSNQEAFWPYSSISSATEGTLSCAKPHNHVKAFFTPNPFTYRSLKITPEVSLKWKGLNTVLVDVKPWALFINSLEADLVIVDHSGHRWNIPSCSVITPPVLNGNFSLGIIMEKECFISEPICMFQKVKSKTQSRDPAINLVIDQTTVVVQLKPLHKKVVIFQLKCVTYQKMFIIKASPLLVLKNNLSEDVHISGIVVFSPPLLKPKLEKEKMKQLLVVRPNGAEKPILHLNSFDYNQYRSLPGKKDNTSFYLSFCICTSSKHKWSLPINLSFGMPMDVRNTVAVPCDSYVKSTCGMRACVLTSHQRDGALFLQISEDPCPFLHLFNRTSLVLFYGQCIAKTGSTCVCEELDNSIPLPTLAPGESSYYTFPALQKQFPVPLDTLPKLHLGLDVDGSCLWSSPIDITHNNQFVCIPESTYVRISQKQQGLTICLYIDLVNRVEFTAKEIRSRIGMSNQCTEKPDYCVDANLTSKTYFVNESCLVKGQKHPSNSSVEKEQKMKKVLMKSVAVCLTVRADFMSFAVFDDFELCNACVEVIRVTVEDAFLYSRPNHSQEVTEKIQEVCICFGNLQVDNQMDGEGRIAFDFPVILKAHDNSILSAIKSSNTEFIANKARETSLVSIDIVLSIIEHNVFAKTVHINFQPFSLHLEDALYFKMLNLYTSYLPLTFHDHKNMGQKSSFFPEDVIHLSLSMTHPVWIKHLKISLKDVYLTVHASLKLYLSVESSKLKFNDFEKQELFTNFHELGRIIIIHYLTGTLFRAGWVVAALDLLGNPANFARAVGGGLSDFVLLPYHGFLNGPKAFFSGLSHGAASLISGISSGAITCVTNLAASISKNMDILSLDTEHLKRQEAFRRQLPPGVTGGLAQGLSSFGISLLGAVAGVVDHPLQVLVTPTNPLNTAKGVVGGLGKGLIGVFTKPVGGAAEFISQTGHGLLQGAGWLRQPVRKQTPSTVFLDKLPNSTLKFIDKFSQTSGLGELVFAIDAAYLNEAGKYEKVFLLLMSDFLCVFSEESDAQHKTFALSELKCEKSENSLENTLHVTHCDRPDESLFQDFHHLKDRVADYVQKSQQYSSGVIHSHLEDDFMKANVTKYVFFVEKNLKNVFHALFSLAKRKLQRKGFPCV